MNEELLKYISHPPVQEKRGEWQLHDRCYHIKLGIGCVIQKDSRGVFQFADRDIDQLSGSLTSLWLPLPIDPVNPERGVIKWIDKTNWEIRFINSGELYANRQLDYTVIFSGDPLTVLLQVYLWQKGVEV